jgi:hypothetical protein
LLKEGIESQAKTSEHTLQGQHLRRNYALGESGGYEVLQTGGLSFDSFEIQLTSMADNSELFLVSDEQI